MVTIGVTGSPGTGKKSIGLLLAKQLGYRFVDINEIALSNKGVLYGSGEDYAVDRRKLRSLVRKKIDKSDSVVAGHLLPEILKQDEVSLVAVIRCSPLSLEDRLKPRGYSPQKMKDDVGAEILDICLFDALRQFGVGKVAEFDTTGRRPEEVVLQIIRVYEGRTPARIGIVDWLSTAIREDVLSRYF